MQLDITALADTVAFRFSASRAELGQNAGQITWNNNREVAAKPPACDLLDTEEKRDAFRDFVRESGGWTREEIAAWSDAELTALCHQWIMGDIREAGADSLGDIDWREYRRDSEAGRISSRLWYTGRKGPRRKYFFCIGN